MSPRAESKPQGRILIADDEAAIANGLSQSLLTPFNDVLDPVL